MQKMKIFKEPDFSNNDMCLPRFLRSKKKKFPDYQLWLVSYEKNDKSDDINCRCQI